MNLKLTSFVPAHKQTHPEHKPGQIVFSPEPGPNTVINPLGFTDTTLSPKRTECCGNPLRGCMDYPPRNKQDDIVWCQEAFAQANSTSWKMKLEVVIFSDGAGHIQCYGSELVLLPDGTWFMNDTSGG